MVQASTFLGVARVLAAAIVLSIAVGGSLAPASAEPIFRRGRPPIYPYYYSPGRPGGYSFYFGFVPYQKGDYENSGAAAAISSDELPAEHALLEPSAGVAHTINFDA